MNKTTTSTHNNNNNNNFLHDLFFKKKPTSSTTSTFHIANNTNGVAWMGGKRRTSHTTTTSTDEDILLLQPVSSAAIKTEIVSSSAVATSSNITKTVVIEKEIKTLPNNTPSIATTTTTATSSTSTTKHKKTAATGFSSTLRQKYGSKIQNNSQTFLGKGSSGMCFQLKSPVTNQTYCIKSFKRSNNKSPLKWRKEITSEYCIGSLLNHPNLIKTLDLIFESHNVAYQVSELCHGSDLHTLLLNNTTNTTSNNNTVLHQTHSSTSVNNVEKNVDSRFSNDPDFLLGLFKQIVNGVSYMHKQGICHRDIKPENCLLDLTNNQLKIIDFGCSCVFRLPYESTDRKCTGRVGSRPYMAPEEFIQDQYDGSKVDIWALGITLIVLFLKRLPWRHAISTQDQSYRYYHTIYSNSIPKNDHGVGFSSQEEQEQRQRRQQLIILDQKEKLFKNLKDDNIRCLLFSMLNPVVCKRIDCQGVLDGPWFV